MPKTIQAEANPDQGAPARFTWTEALSEDERQATIEWLNKQSGVVQLGFLMRVGESDFFRWQELDRLENINCWIDNALGGYNRFKRLWQEHGYRDAPYNHVDNLAASSMCVVMAPVRCLIHFLTQDFVVADDTPITGIIISELCNAAEERQPFDPTQNHERVRDLVKEIGARDNAYAEYLNIPGLASRWRPDLGAGQSLCVVDSGCDESHPSLNHSIRDHRTFDYLGRYKAGIYASDNGCHGTKISGVAAGRMVERHKLDLDLGGGGQLGLGLAPRSSVIMLKALEGGTFEERAEMTPLFSAIQEALMLKKRLLQNPKLPYQFDVMTICVQLSGPLPPAHLNAVDKYLSLLQHGYGLVTLLPAGNGQGRTPLGTVGEYVGASHPDGRLWNNNGRRVTIVGRGADLLLCQPARRELGRHLVGRHSGTSFATAMIAGLIMLVCAETGRSSRKVLEAMKETMNDDGPDLDATVRALS